MVASTRSDYNTSVASREFFSDFLNDFSTHPVNNTLIKISNENSIRQSVKNLILTNLGERLFQPNIGSNVYKSLFEPNDVVTAQNIKFFIDNTLKACEPRIQTIEIAVVPSSDSYSFNVNIIFSIINTSKTTSVNLILRRVR